MHGSPSRPPDGDVAHRGAGADLHALLGAARLARWLEVVVDVAGDGADVEVRRRPLPDADLEVAHGRLEHDRPTRDLAQADIPVGGLGHGGAASEVDHDRAVCGVDAQVAAGDADPGVAVGVLDDGAAVDLAQAHVARRRRDLDAAGGVVDGDVARAALHADRAGHVEADVADAGADPDGAERAVAGEVGGPRGAVETGAGRDLQRDVDGPAAAAAQPRAQLRALDDEMAVGVVHARELGGLAVLVVRRVAGAHLHDGVAPVGGDDADVAHGDVDVELDGLRGVEGRHQLTHPL